MKFSESNSAVVLIEFQNQWTESGLYHFLIKKQLQSRDVLNNTRTVVEQARKAGVKIIHAPLVIDPRNKRGWLAHLTFGRVFTLGSRKAEITSGLYQENDLLAKDRYAFDAFLGSDLEELLRDNQIDTVFLCGFTTDQCVAKTLKSALRKGFNGYLVSDCTATVNGVFQRRTERRFQEHVISAHALLDLLR